MKVQWQVNQGMSIVHDVIVIKGCAPDELMP